MCRLVIKYLQVKTDDYIIATGKTHSLKDVLKEAFLINNLNYKKFVEADKKKKRKFDIIENYADIKKIKTNLNWKPRFNLKKLFIKCIVMNLNKHLFESVEQIKDVDEEGGLRTKGILKKVKKMNHLYL